jgi:peroxiredoxin
MSRKFVILLLVSSVFFLFSCNEKGSFKVSGKLDNSSGEWVVLKELTVADIVPVDSMRVSEKGKFVLKGKNTRIAFYNLYINNSQPVTLVIKPGDRIFITGDAKDFAHTYSVEGSEESLLVKELTEHLNYTIKRIDTLNFIYRDSLGSPNILKVKAHLDSMFNIIQNDQIEFTKKFIHDHKGSLVTVMALYQQLTPRRALLSPSLHYPLFKEVDSIMSLTYPDADAVKSLHQLMDNISEDYLKKLELEKRIGIGATAPDFTLPDFNNSPVSLSAYKGKYLILNFWASWSDPCHPMNQFLTKMYYRYHNAGLNVLQVSLDRSRDAWLTAITTNGLPWPNISDLKMWDSPVVALYGIEKLPFTLLLDKEGKILLKNPTNEELQAKLTEIFKY